MNNTVNNIVLTGFMATGKSTIGRMLADRLGRTFIDTDVLIESRHGPIADIFAGHGEAHFRDIERDIAAELGRRSGLVISTGGRMLLDAVNARSLTANGEVFCLTATADEILARVNAQDIERPLLGDDPAERVRVLLAERAAGYGRYRQVSTSGRSPEAVVDTLIEFISAPVDGTTVGRTPSEDT